MKNINKYIYIAGTLFFCIIYFKNCWVAEDAYILFRSIEQLYAGNGPIWNPHERVQVFTSPLWYILLSVIRAFSSNVYTNSIIISLYLCLGTLYILKILLNNLAKWLCVVALLCSSKGFFDYTSSGIENSLVYFLLVIFIFYFSRLSFSAKESNSSRNFCMLLFSFGLLLVCRHDLVTIALPPVCLTLWKHKAMQWKKIGIFLLAGLSPFIVWSVFSLFYYGFTFPNTAYAKLNTDIPRGDLLKQGGNYLLSSIQHDLITISAIVIALLFLILHKSLNSQTIACGVLLNLLYVVNIGGDFMQGRFLSFAYIVSVSAAFSCIQIPHKIAISIVAACCLYWFTYQDNPVCTSTNYSKSASEVIDTYGVADERGCYFKYTSIWSYLKRDRTILFPLDNWSRSGFRFSISEEPITVSGNIGFFGYWSGTNKIIIDEFALADPFLSRLPSLTPWRIGHFKRKLPDGYLVSVYSGKNIIVDPELKQLYSKIQLITQGPLWQTDRISTIIRFNLGLN